MQERRLAAILFTDIVGYTSLMGSDEDKAFKVLKINHDIHDTCIRRYDGTLIKEMGDGILASFSSSYNAVQCAIKILEETRGENIKLRIGIHEGDVVFEGGDVLGAGVNVASRLENSAAEGTIYISEAVFRNIRNKADIKTKYIDELTFKNVDGPIKVYKVLFEEQDEKKSNPQITNRESKIEFKKSKLHSIILISIIAITISGLVIWQFLYKQSSSTIIEKDKSIAVLPFDNESAVEENIYFVNGMMEDIRNNLAKIEGIHVISKTSTEKYRESTLNSKKIADELGVNYLLEGTVQRQGDQVKIHVQLIEAKKDNHIWAETYRHELKNIFDIQSEIATQIANSLSVIITPEEKEIIETIPTINLTAYDFFLRAREEHSKFWLGGDFQNLERAVSNYKNALKTDSTYAQAYTGLALAYENIFYSGMYWGKTFSVEETETYRDTIFNLVDKALTYNKKSEEAYLVRGKYYAGIGDVDLAIGDLKRAIKINPNYSTAYNELAEIFLQNKKDIIAGIQLKIKAIKLERGPNLPNLLQGLGVYYEYIGFYDNAIDVYKKVFRLTNDTLTYYQSMSGPFYCQENWNESNYWAKKMLEIDSTNFWAHFQLLRSYFFAGNIDSMSYHINKLELLNKNSLLFGPTGMYYAVGLLHKGEKNEAKKIFTHQIEYYSKLIDPNVGEAFYFKVQLSKVLVLNGEPQKAIEQLKNNDFKSFQQRWFILEIDADPIFDEIQNDKDFQLIVNTMKTVWQQEHDKVGIWLEENNLLIK